MQADAHQFENEKNDLKNSKQNNDNKNSSNDDSSYSSNSNSINTHKKNHDVTKITTDSVSNNIMPILDEGIEKIGREVEKI